MSCDIRDHLSDLDRPYTDLSIDTSGLVQRRIVVEKSQFEHSQNRPKTGLPANFKFKYIKNESEIQKSGPMDFRYCPKDS